MLSGREEELKTIWENFQLTGYARPNSILREEVLDSWKRCRLANMDPCSKPNRRMLSGKELKERITKNSLLIDAASSILHIFTQSIDSSGFRFDLLDTDLFLLTQYGDKKSIEIAQKHGIFPGLCRQEAVSGTTAICLADEYKKPVQLVGPEHYNVNLHSLTCSSTPVFSSDGKYLGILSMSGDFSLFHKHTLGLVVAMSKIITLNLIEKEILKEQQMSKEYLNNIVNAISDGIIVIDDNNEIKTVNTVAEKLFNKKQTEIINTPVKKIFGENNVFSRVLKTKESINDTEVMLQTDDRTYRFISNIKNMEKQAGVIGILKPMSSAKSIIKNVCGLKAHYRFKDIIGESKKIRDAKILGKNAALVPTTTVLLQGESGTGKEIFAQAIHNESCFRNGPFVALNCAAVPGELVESELFGYEDGAFTGAKKSGRHGKFELAENGTIFLDEINSMSMAMQAKLLRVLQNKKIVRLGGNNEIEINARIICASNKDLWEQVKKGLFREDLFYRINVLTIDIPPLREIKEDIVLLADYFNRLKSRQFNVELEISQEVFELFCQYDWPGNIRELENVIERSMVIALGRQSHTIELQDVLNYRGISDFLNNLSTNADNNSTNTQVFNLSKMEMDAINGALRLSNKNLSQAAKMLGISRTTLYRKIKNYDLDCNII